MGKMELDLQKLRSLVFLEALGSLCWFETAAFYDQKNHGQTRERQKFKETFSRRGVMRGGMRI